MLKFINATAHELTNEQLNEIKKLWGDDTEIVSLPIDLKAKLTNLPNDINETYKAVEEFMNFFSDVCKSNEGKVILHLPIGSPLFMYMLAQKLGDWYQIAFSHSDRKSIEKKNDDGSVVKTSIFEFKGFNILEMRTPNFND